MAIDVQDGLVIRNAIEHNASRPRVRPHSDAEPYFTVWAERFTTPTVIVTLDMKVLWANRAALDRSEDGGDFALTDDILTWADKGQATGFRDFILGLDDQTSAWIYRARGDEYIIVRGEPLRPQGSPPAVALMFRPSNAARQYIWSDFGPIFGLTRAEAGVARHVAEGMSARQIADLSSLSIETVRTHIRRIYAKSSVNNREQLLALINPFRIL